MKDLLHVAHLEEFDPFGTLLLVSRVEGREMDELEAQVSGGKRGGGVHVARRCRPPGMGGRADLDCSGLRSLLYSTKT